MCYLLSGHLPNIQDNLAAVWRASRLVQIASCIFRVSSLALNSMARLLAMPQEELPLIKMDSTSSTPSQDVIRTHFANFKPTVKQAKIQL